MADDKMDDELDSGKSPVEKMRIRLAAESYNKKYDVMHEDSDDERNTDGKKSCRRPCCSGRTISPCVILITIVVLVGVGFALLAVLLKIRLDQVSNVCHSSDCVVTSANMLTKMDLSVDKCTDFYQYACNAYINDITIPVDKMKYSVLAGEMEHTRLPRIRKLLEEEGSQLKGENSTAVAKARKYYAACMDVKGVDGRGNVELLKLISTVGRWTVTSDPVSGVWDSNTWSLESSLAAANEISGAPFFNVYVATDDRNCSVNVLTFDQGGLSLGSYASYLGNSSAIYHAAFVEYFVTVSKLLGAQHDTTTLAEDIWDLERAIAEAFIRPEDRTNVRLMYHIMSVNEFNAVFNNVDNNVFNVNQFLQLSYGSRYNPTMPLNVRALQYFTKLAVLLRYAKRETMANYIVWNAVQSMVPFMPTPYRQALLQLRQSIYGVQGESQRWELCTAGTNAALGFATGALFVDKYFSDADKLKVESVYSQLVAAFQRRLSHNEWMDETTRVRALDKLSAVSHKIGYPPFVTVPAQLDQYYAQVDINNNSFQNALSIAKFEVLKNKNKIGQVPDRDEWDMTPDEINAYYQPSANEVVVPAGILQKPIYNGQYPMSLIFGSIGFVIGHELTHGFDNKGGQYDRYGNMFDWWTNSSAEQFENLSQCFVDEYNEFIIYGQHVNGKSTLSENIADNGGLRISYNALHNWLETQNANDVSLPGLNMTVNQQFFLSFAQTWCSFYKPQYALQLLVLDVHSNSRDRVNGVLRNMPEFASAFQCPTMSAMNPKKKCSLW